jgi:hypothetical protein
MEGELVALMTLYELKCLIDEHEEHFQRLHGKLGPSSELIIHDKTTNAGFLVQTKEGFYTIWQYEEKIRPLHYQDLESLRHCLKFKKMNRNKDGVDMIEEAISYVNEAFRIHALLDKGKDHKE